ncbi:MAG: 4-demethylwyosine synthase TYW1 [Candidatus Aenigmatarchaeota archaeon]|nr:4-demethylwyosine synthase TYW1 [Candidatus Aenigmarchaeota archaeon]
MPKFTEDRLKKYKKAGYRIVGSNKHTGVEICRWTKSVLRGGRNCYKAVYGIRSHRCVQMTPTLDFCPFSCKFCWRTFGPERFKTESKWDSPKEIVDAIIDAQIELLSGFGGNPKTKRELWNEAKKPVHVAISLDGEPTLYPDMVGLIKEIKSRGMTAFLVTNGTMPHRLKELIEKDAEPTNIYISVYATNKEDYKVVTNSFLPDEWERVNESLKLMKDFKHARTVFRMTMVKDLNMKDPEGYSKLINMAKPHFVELKGYSHLGESKFRLKKENMPSLDELKDFADAISKHTGYIIKSIDKVSRVIIMVRDQQTWEWSLKKIEEQNKIIYKKNISIDMKDIENY